MFEKSGWSVLDHTGTIDYYDDKFYFQNHPLASGFDTGAVWFGYSEPNGDPYLNSISLVIDFTEEENCKVAYQKIFNQLNHSANTKAVGWKLNRFNNFKRLVLSIFRARGMNKPYYYSISLGGAKDIPRP